MSAEDKISVILDTDPGVDDFFAIAMLCANRDRIHLLGLTAEGGNNTTAVTAQNALNVLSLLGCDDVPVARGMDQYLTAPFGEPVAKFHGVNGMGNVDLPKSGKSLEKVRAWDFIYAKAVEAGNLVLVTVGPLTNIAVALCKYPDLKNHVSKIVMMGGTTDRGNIGPYTEANMGHDALASRIVFESGIPIDMVGLNVTRDCIITPEEFDAMDGNCDPLIASVMRQLIVFRNGEALHDPIAAAALLKPEIMSWQEAYTEIEFSEAETNGMCHIDPSRSDRYNSRIAMKLNQDAYREMFKEMVRKF
jgi:inosine-uridine nucleoside N-ribohydrolase